MDVLVEKIVFAWMSMNLRKGKPTGNDGCYHWFAFWICALLGFAALPGDEPLPFNKLLFPHVPTPLLLVGMVSVVLQGNVFNFPVWCLCNKKQMFLGMHCQSGGGVGSTFCMGWHARVYAANYHFLYLGDGFLVLQCSAANIAPAKWYQARRGARGHCFESVWFLSGKMCLEYKSGWSSDESLHSGVPQVSVIVIYFACLPLPPCFCCFCLL